MNDCIYPAQKLVSHFARRMGNMSDDQWTSHIKQIIEKHNRDRSELLAILKDVQEKWRRVSPEAVTLIADELDLPRVHVEGTATFYHFLSRTHRGNYTVYVNTSATAEMAGAVAVAQAFESEVGVLFGQN